MPAPTDAVPNPNRWAIRGLRVGIVSVLLPLLGVTGIVAAVFSIIGLRRVGELQRQGLPPKGRKSAIWGIVVAAVSLIIAGGSLPVIINTLYPQQMMDSRLVETQITTDLTK